MLDTISYKHAFLSSMLPFLDLSKKPSFIANHEQSLIQVEVSRQNINKEIDWFLSCMTMWFEPYVENNNEDWAVVAVRCGVNSVPEEGWASTCLLTCMETHALV